MPICLGARVVRILPDFAAICRPNWFIFFVFRVRERTLDQHIGVRIPGGQPIFLQYLSTFPHPCRVRPFRYPFLCRQCVAI